MITRKLHTHFDASRVPFRRLPPTEAFVSRDLREISRQLQILDALGGLAVCVGEPGCGKTYAVDAATTHIGIDNSSVYWINDPGQTLFSFFRRAVAAIGAPTRHNTEALWQQLASFITSHTQKGDNSLVLVVDEAQQLTAQVLEAIRRLTNLSRLHPQTLQIVLIGHAQLLAAFNRAQQLAVRRRLTAVAELAGLTRQELPNYLDHHLERADIDSSPFSQPAIDELWSLSRGVPRLINRLALHALYHAAEQHTNTVQPDVVVRIAEKLKLR